MNIGVEISLYPLRNEFIPPIRDFIDRLNADGRFKVITNDMSTQVFGRYEEVMEALTRELRPTFERDGKAIFVMKVLGPLGLTRCLVTLPSEVLTTLEVLATVTGVAFAVLAARRNRLCWLAGAVSSACAAWLAGLRGLPMQSGLQVFFVGMAVYGWFSWTRSSRQGEVLVGTWPLRWHVIAAGCVVLLSFASARVLAQETGAAWPLLDSLTTGFSLLATWLQARARLENWLYWVVIDTVLAFLFYQQQLPYLALLNVLFIAIAVSGFIAWRRRLLTQVVLA